MVDGGLRDFGLGGIDNHHDVVRAVAADTLDHGLGVLLIARDVNEGENLLRFLKNLLLTQELEVVDVCDFALLIESEDAVIDRRSISVQNSVLVSLDSNARATLAVVALARHEDSKQGALACTLRTDEEDLDIKFKVVCAEFVLSQFGLND